MLFRAEQAKWFETYIPREQTVIALESLAGSGQVALESDRKLANPLFLKEIREAVSAYQRFRQRYARFLPKTTPGYDQTLLMAPEQMAQDALTYLAEWGRATDELLDRQTQLQTEQKNLLLLREYLTALQGAPSELVRLTHQSEFLYKGLFACSAKHRLEAEVCAALEEYLAGKEHNFYIVADLPNNQTMVEKACREELCQQVRLPDWLPADPDQQLPQVDTRVIDLETQLQELEARIKSAGQAPGLIAASEALSLLSWFIEHSAAMSDEQKLCHLTGWTTAEQMGPLQQALDRVGIQAAIRFTEPPKYAKPPVSLLLPKWALPFLPFVEMLGTPDRSEVNPTLLLPAVVSLLFGYMFPDVGHGLMLIGVSLLLYRRWPKGRFLIPCGLSAILFGFVFGEVFGLEGILEPLWISPLDSPLLILIPPICFGIGLLLLGLLLNGFGAYWRGQLKTWLLRDAAIILLYVGLVSGVYAYALLWLVVVAIVWFLLGQLFTAGASRVGRLLASLAALLQSLFELLLNTISFLRVGAFALAHAALTAAILQMLDGIDNTLLHGLFFVLGQIVILAIEGLVVFVQTTRLVLFEFFTRFLKADGRIFRPLSVPQRFTDLTR